MKLATLETTSGLTVVSVDHTDETSQRYVNLCAVDTGLPTSMKSLLAANDGLARAHRAHERGVANATFVDGRLRAPIVDPGKILCIGLNYRDHARESGMEPPNEPVCFSKFANTIIGHNEAIRLPRVASRVDFEAELVVVIGRRGYGIAREEAFNHVAGYLIGNDVSARDWQIGRPGKQWLLGKTPDTFAPTGPHIVTSDDIADPHDLRIQLRLNGETMQDSSTDEFIFGVDEVIAHVAQLITLEPGDLIFTGTPPGVGFARKPPVFLQPDDHVEVEIDGLGILSNPVAAWS